MAWDQLLESLWRADHGGKSLEGARKPEPKGWWNRLWPIMLAIVVVFIYLAMVLELGGMEL